MISDLAKQILRNGLDDWVPLGAVAGLVRKSGLSSDQAIRAATAALVKELTSEGLAVLGRVTPHGFVLISEPAAIAIDRIVSASSPDAGDAWHFDAWLSNTEKGDALIKAT